MKKYNGSIIITILLSVILNPNVFADSSKAAKHGMVVGWGRRNGRRI